MLCLGFPRLTTVSSDALVPVDGGGLEPEGVRQKVMVRDEQAYIPDLPRIETMIAEALAHAA
jgi:chemosensory pili system protein ChpC